MQTTPLRMTLPPIRRHSVVRTDALSRSSSAAGSLLLESTRSSENTKSLLRRALMIETSCASHNVSMPFSVRCVTSPQVVSCAAQYGVTVNSTAARVMILRGLSARTSSALTQPLTLASVQPSRSRPSSVSSTGSVYEKLLSPPPLPSAMYKSVTRSEPETLTRPSAISRLRTKRQPLPSTMRAMSGQ